MDIWNKLCEKAKQEYHPEDVSPFVMWLITLYALWKPKTERYSQAFALKAAAEL